MENTAAGTINDQIEDENKSFDQETIVKETSTEPAARKTKRKAAMKSTKNIEQLISRGLLKVDGHVKKVEPPNHAWDYDVFQSMMEEEDYCFYHAKLRPINDKDSEENRFIEVNDLENSGRILEETENERNGNTDNVENENTENIDAHEANDDNNASDLSWDYSPEQFDDDAVVQDLGQAFLVLHDADGRHARGDNDDEDVCDENVRDQEDAHVEANVRAEEDTHDKEGNDEQRRRTEKVNYLPFHLYGQK